MQVAEKFVSINGEGLLAGQLSVFIRFKGCNLSCEYCDTKWANEKDAEYDNMTPQQIYDYIKSTGVCNVTVTGGEPLLQPDIYDFLSILAADAEIHTEIETNGSVDIGKFADICARPSFTLDYKLDSSGMEDFMLTSNYDYIDKRDCVKFVSGCINDLEKAKLIIDRYNLTEKTNVYISPVFGSIDMPEIVEFMINNNMNKVRMQLQLHKFIWDPDRKGV